MQKSKYIGAFRAVPKELLQIIGAGLLVEEIPKEEVKSKGGIFMPSSNEIKSVDGLEANRPCWVRVLAVGEGYFSDDGEVPLDCKPDNIVLVPKLSVKWLSVFGNIVGVGGSQIGLVDESSVQLKFENDEAYTAYFTALEAGIREEKTV